MSIQDYDLQECIQYVHGEMEYRYNEMFSCAGVGVWLLTLIFYMKLMILKINQLTPFFNAIMA